MALKNFIKENFVLVIGLTLPVLLVVLFFVASVIPKSMMPPPQYDIVFSTVEYTSQAPPAYHVDFLVRDGGLKARVAKNEKNQHGYINNNATRLFVFNAKTQTVTPLHYDMSKIPADTPNGSEIVFEEFKDMKLDDKQTAPDGYSFEGNGYWSGGITREVFGGSYRNGARVKKGAVAYKIPEYNTGGHYYSWYDIRFIGWIIK